MPKKEAAVKTIQMGSKVEEKVPCSECKKEVGAQERHVFKGKSNTDIYYCDSCVEKINEALANETKNPNIIKAVLVGAMAGFIGTIGWYLFVILTQYQIGYIGIALGWLIGTAYVKGAGEKRGHQLQLLAAITTLISLLGADLFIFTHFSAEYFNSEFDFIAMDFETANNNRVSACALGLAFVKNETFVHKEKHFILPPQGEKILNTHKRIHGIQEEDLEFALDFKQLWDSELFKYFNNNLIVFHNASMELSVLKSLFSHYKIDDFNINYIDTMKLAELSGKPKKLTELASLFDIPIIKHHDPQEDAEVCANVFSELKDLVPNFKDLVQCFSSETLQDKVSTKGVSLKIQNDNMDIVKQYSISKEELQELRIEGSGFIFTGELTEDREICKEFVVRNGGLIKPTITSRVNFVVIGVGYGWSKIQKVHQLNSEKNCQIRLLSNSDFRRLKERFNK